MVIDGYSQVIDKNKDLHGPVNLKKNIWYTMCYAVGILVAYITQRSIDSVTNTIPDTAATFE